MFFIGQNLKHVHMKNSHDLPLIKCHYIKEILYININSNCKRDTNRFIFSLACDIDFEKFLKIPYQQLLIFLSFMNTLFERN